MVIADLIFKDDSRNLVLPSATFESRDIVIDNTDYSTVYGDPNVFFIAIHNFSKKAIELNNTGAGSIDYQISGKVGLPDPDLAADLTWGVIKDGEGSLDSKANKTIFVNEAYPYLLIRFKETTPATSSILNLHLRAIN